MSAAEWGPECVTSVYTGVTWLGMVDSHGLWYFSAVTLDAFVVSA